MTTSPSQNAEGHQVWNPSVGTYFNPASGQRESYGGVVGALQDQIARQTGTSKSYPANFAGIIAAIEDLVFTQKEAPVTPAVKPNGGSVGTDADGNPEWIVGVAPRDGELWFDTRQGRLFIAIDEEYYQTNGADGLAQVTQNSVAPTSPVLGQFWWDISTNTLYIFDGYWKATNDVISGYWSPGATPIWRVVTSTSTTFEEGAVAIPSGSVILREPAGDTLPTLDFANVTNQSQFNSWIYNALESLEAAIDADEGGNARLQAGSTAPSSPEEGHLWYDTGSNTLKIYTSNSWVNASPQLNYDGDITSVTTLINTEQSARQTAITALSNQVATAVTGSANFQSLESDVAALQTQVDAIPIVDSSLLTPVTTTDALDTRVTTLEAVVPDFSVVESATNAASNLATVNARIDALPTVSQLNAVSASIPSLAGLASEAYVGTQVSTISSHCLPRTGGTLTGSIVLNKSDVATAALDFSTAATDSQNAFKFVSNDGFNGNHTATYGTTDNYWEYAHKFNQNEDFCWIHNNNKVASINKDGIACNDLYLAGFQPNTTDGRVISNSINVRTKLSEYDTEFATVRTDIAALNTALGTATGRVFYGDTAPTVTTRNGDVWFDSSTLRLYVNHGGAWIYPDRVEDTALKTSLLNAVNSSTDYATLKSNLATALS